MMVLVVAELLSHSLSLSEQVITSRLLSTAVAAVAAVAVLQFKPKLKAKCGVSSAFAAITASIIIASAVLVAV